MEYLKQYLVLFKKAHTDLVAAKILLEDFNNGQVDLDLEIVMFHLQQCAEKLLKSILAFNQQHFTKTHSIETLLESCKQNNIILIDDIEKLVPLSDYAAEGRYAIIHDDLENADDYIVILEELLAFVKNIMVEVN